MLFARCSTEVRWKVSHNSDDLTSTSERNFTWSSAKVICMTSWGERRDRTNRTLSKTRDILSDGCLVMNDKTARFEKKLRFLETDPACEWKFKRSSGGWQQTQNVQWLPSGTDETSQKKRTESEGPCSTWSVLCVLLVVFFAQLTNKITEQQK